MAPAADGFVHEDDDLRATLRKITCPACVRRTARNQTRKPSARGTGRREIAGHTRLVAEAYTRLAEIEENLEGLEDLEV